ncbi:hypothetical protein [Streptomyces virginiae]|uniref:hypothetical protein n=1 Tax=Streptomyces virginiae TaxID=1961 RepID=UPI003431885C
MDDPTPGLSTVFATGMPLAEAGAEQGPFPAESAAPEESALAAVHAAGRVHRT